MKLHIYILLSAITLAILPDKYWLEWPVIILGGGAAAVSIYRLFARAVTGRR